jgi:hypothetical protein
MLLSNTHLCSLPCCSIHNFVRLGRLEGLGFWFRYQWCSNVFGICGGNCSEQCASLPSPPPLLLPYIPVLTPSFPRAPPPRALPHLSRPRPPFPFPSLPFDLHFFQTMVFNRAAVFFCFLAVPRCVGSIRKRRFTVMRF